MSMQGMWQDEKAGLLQTHKGWFVAYQNDKRVALESSLDKLLAAMEAKLGKQRKPCEIHEIVEQSRRRGPSPRLWPKERAVDDAG